MNYSERTKEELISDLNALQKSFNEVREKYESEISQLHLAEEELSKSEEKFRKAFVTSPDSININRLDDGMYVSINNGFTKIMGYTESDVIGKTSIELNIWKNPEDRKRLVDGLKARGEVENLEAEFVSKNGEIIYGMMSAALIDLSGVPHILNITRDITERKYAAIALKESENRYRELIELAVDGILLGSDDGIIIGANTCILNLSGRTLDQLLGTHVTELFDKDEMARLPLRFDRLKKGEVVIFERMITRPDGTKIPVEMHTKMMPDGSYQSIFHDITERREAEKALRESEEWFRKLFEQSNDGIFYLDLEGKIVAVNKAFAEMHGYTLDEIKSMNINDLDSMEERQYYPERMKRLQNGENLKFEVNHIHKDGHHVPLEVTAGMISMGSKSYLFSSHRDITERRKADETMKFAMAKAEASDRLKTSFLNNISHEVRTPLNGILGFSEILTKDTLDQEEKEEAFTMVNECSNRLLETITNFMDISLILSGEMNISKSGFNPLSLLQEIIQKYETDCSKANIGLSLDTKDIQKDTEIYSDPELIRKVLTHLMNNAIKFTEKGSITLGCKVISGNLQFFVTDTGIGIGREALKEIFAYFVKEDQSAASPSEGSGLGLSISKGIINLLGGEMNVESVRGKGSVFSFSLPIMDIVRNRKVTSGTRHTTKKLLSILIAEDDEANFLYLKALLFQNTKAEIIHAANGKEAIEKFGINRDVDIILMDMKMPVIDGFEATRKIKSIDPGVPVIAVTAYAMPGDEKRIREAGCDEYMTKPISKNVLLEKMSKFVTV